MKNKYYILLIVGVAIIILMAVEAYQLFFYPAPDLMKIHATNYDTVRIENRGLALSFDTLSLINRADIITFCELLREAKRVQYDSITINVNRGLCDIYMIGKKQTFSFDYTQTTYSGGIIQNNAAYYRNDSLMHFLETASASSARRGRILP